MAVMKRGRWLASAAVACWMLLAGATQASEYIRGLGATGDPRVIARVVADLERLWPLEIGRYCANYRDLLNGIRTSDSHKSNLQTVEATVNPLLEKKEAVISEDSDAFVAAQGDAIRLLLVTAGLPDVPIADRLRIADRCLDCLEAWRKEILPEYDGLRVVHFNVLIGGADAAAQQARAQLKEEERISYRNSLILRRQSALRFQIRLNVTELGDLLLETGKQSPELLEVTNAMKERAELLWK